MYNGGFKKNSMTADNMFVLLGCIQRSKALGQPLYVCFVDFKRAFDTVNREMMFYKLLKRKIDGKIIRILRDMYKKTSAKVCVNGMLSDLMNDETGVNQGGPNSPDMFVDFLSDLRDYLDESCGVVLNDSLILLHLLWADDLVLISNSANGLRKLIDNLFKYCAKYQMIVNAIKTKNMIFPNSKSNGEEFFFNNEPIETVTQYKYVGSLFSSENNIFKNHLDYTISKATRASFKIQNLCKQFGQVPPFLAVKLFNTLVTPILEYGSEIWASGINTTTVDKFQAKFLKRILHVRKSTPNIAVLSETGELPSTLKISQKITKYYLRIQELPDHHIVKQTFTMLESLDNVGHKTWVTDLKKHLTTLGQDITTLEGKTRKCFPTIKTNVQNNFAEHALKTINDMEIYPKLRTYKLVKTNLQFEPYLYITIPKYRSSLSRFRLSSHDLQIERGRYTRPKTPVDDRKCRFCQNNAIEDEIHFLLICNKYNNIRSDMLNTVNNFVTGLSNLDSQTKFVTLLTNDQSEVLHAVGKYLWKAEQIRKHN